MKRIVIITLLITQALAVSAYNSLEMLEREDRQHRLEIQAQSMAMQAEQQANNAMLNNHYDYDFANPGYYQLQQQAHDAREFANDVRRYGEEY